MKGFMNDIPHSLIESSKIDGANELTIYFRIVIPLAVTGIATISLFLVLQIWNDWFQSLLYIDSEGLYTLQYLLLKIVKQTEFLNRMLSSGAFGATTNDLPTLSSRMATAILAAGPILFVFPFFQRYFVKGITIGSLKG
jgi:putative aldouronate transport system permease protein